MQRTLFPRPARRAWVTAAAAAALAWGDPARAQQEHPPIILELDPCAGVDAQEVLRLVPIEMGAPLVLGAGDPRETTRVSLGCVPDLPHAARLEVHNPTTGKTLARVLALSDVPRFDQARLVAIAAVELVAASWSALGHSSDEIAPGAAPPSAAPTIVVVAAPPAPPPRASRWRALAVADLRHFGGLPRLVPGGGIAVQRELRAGLAVGGDVLVDGGPQPTTLGTVDCLMVSAGLHVLARVRTARVTWEPGVGVRFGPGRLAGRAADLPALVSAGRVAGPWLGPLAGARALLALPHGFVASLGGEVGDATVGLLGHVPGAADVSIKGPWWSASVGLGHAF